MLKPDQLALNVCLRADATFETFAPDEDQVDLVCGLNAFSSIQGSESQWYLWGAPQTGKTHLAQAACHAAASNGFAVGYLPVQEFLTYGPGCLEGMDGLAVLALDNVDAVWTDEGWARALFALINTARERGSRLLFTASSRPDDSVWADLRSRLLWGPVYHLKRLSDAGLALLIRRASQARGLGLGADEVQYLLHHGPREPRGLVELLEQVDRASLRAKRRVTVPLIRDVLTVSAQRITSNA